MYEEGDDGGDLRYAKSFEEGISRPSSNRALHVVVSDIHLGYSFGSKTLDDATVPTNVIHNVICNFARMKGVTNDELVNVTSDLVIRLVLLGDVLDTCVHPPGEDFPSLTKGENALMHKHEVQRFFKCIIECLEKIPSLQVFYVLGNRDHGVANELEDFYESLRSIALEQLGVADGFVDALLGRFKTCDELDSFEVHFEHGHGDSLFSSARNDVAPQIKGFPVGHYVSRLQGMCDYDSAGSSLWKFWQHPLPLKIRWWDKTGLPRSTQQGFSNPIMTNDWLCDALSRFIRSGCGSTPIETNFRFGCETLALKDVLNQWHLKVVNHFGNDYSRFWDAWNAEDDPSLLADKIAVARANRRLVVCGHSHEWKCEWRKGAGPRPLFSLPWDGTKYLYVNAGSCCERWTVTGIFQNSGSWDVRQMVLSDSWDINVENFVAFEIETAGTIKEQVNSKRTSSTWETSENKGALVLDCGSDVCKAGLAGDDAPIALFPSVARRPRHLKEVVGVEKKDSYVGGKNESSCSTLTLKYPIENGIITNWDEMESIWHNAFHNILHKDPEEHAVLFAETPLNPRRNRERTAEIMFENFNSPAVHLRNSGILALYASGITSGTVLGVGDGASHTVPIYEGYVVPDCMNRQNLGGRNIDDMLMQILRKRGCNLVTTADREIVRDIKENLCYMALDFDHEMMMTSESTHVDKTYRLPDGQLIKIGYECSMCPESLMQPRFVDVESGGIQDACLDCIMKCPGDFRKALFGNVVLSGGSTMFPGFAERLHKELVEFAPSKTRVNIIAPADRKVSVWVGGSILASLSTFQQMWVRRQEYDEDGPTIVHSKCD